MFRENVSQWSQQNTSFHFAHVQWREKPRLLSFLNALLINERAYYRVESCPDRDRRLRLDFNICEAWNLGTASRKISCDVSILVCGDKKTYFKAKRDCLTTLTKFLILTRAEVLRWHKMKLKIEAKRKSCSRYVFCRKVHFQHPLLQIGLVRGANACKSWKRPAASSLVN